MQVTFLGTGEAFSPTKGSCSVLLEFAGAGEVLRALLDCGFTTPQRLFSISDTKDLSFIYISHLHGDHFFGLPAILVRSWEEQRRKELVIVCPPGGEKVLKTAVELAYPGTLEKLEFEVEFIESGDGKVVNFDGIKIKTVRTLHSVDSYAVRIDQGGKRMVYTGDGTLTNADFCREADLLISEAYQYENAMYTRMHGTLEGASRLAREAKCKKLALVHVSRGIEGQKTALEKAREIFPETLMPDDNDVYRL